MVESFRDSDSVYIASVYYINLGIPGSKTEAGAFPEYLCWASFSGGSFTQSREPGLTGEDLRLTALPTPARPYEAAPSALHLLEFKDFCEYLHFLPFVQGKGTFSTTKGIFRKRPKNMKFPVGEESVGDEQDWIDQKLMVFCGRLFAH